MQANETRKVHALSLHGTPRHAAAFDHFDYVNPDAPKGGTMVRGGFGTFDNFNPFIVAGVAADDLALIYDTLTIKGLNEPSTEYGLLAEKIELSVAQPDWVIFHLRKNAYFSDLHPVTAEDVVFSFNILTTKGNPLYRSYYGDVVKVEALDQHRVKFSFRSAENHELPQILGQLTVLPKHYWEKKDFTAVNLDVPLGSGPYLIDEFQAGRSISYKRNPHYWAKDLAVNRGRHNFDSIKYRYYRDTTVMHEAFKAGEIDVLQENQAKRWHEAYDFPAFRQGKVIKKEFPHKRNQGMQAFVFNTRRPIFASPQVRQALNYAFDFEWSNKNLFFDSYKRSYSFFSNSELAASGLPSAAEMEILNPYRKQLPPEVFTEAPTNPRTDKLNGIRENLGKAIELLKKGGWEIKNGKLLSVKDGKQMKFEILLILPTFERIVSPFSANLRRLGIDVSYRVVDTTQYINRVQSYDFDMIVSTFAQSESPGNEQRDFWTSRIADIEGGRNVIGIKNRVIDELVEDLIRTQTREELINYCRALDRVLLWHHYVIPQWYLAVDRISYWDKFATPAIVPSGGMDFSSWWAKQ